MSLSQRELARLATGVENRDSRALAQLDGLPPGHARIVGIWSHLACADIPGHPSISAQLAAFRAAVELAEKAGARPEVRHLANTPATLTLPEAWFDLVRTGGGIFGLSTLPGGPPGWLRPAMTVRTVLVQVKRVPAGTGVSFNADTKAAATARSAAGSTMRRPPAMLR